VTKKEKKQSKANDKKEEGMMKDGKGATQEDNDLLVEDVTKRNLSTAKIETEVDGEMDVTIPREALTCDNNQEKKKKKNS